MSKKSNTQNTNSTGNVTYTSTNNTGVVTNFTTTSTPIPEFDYEEQKRLFLEHMEEKLSRDVQTSTVYDKFDETTSTYSSTDFGYLNSLRDMLWKPTNLNNVDLTLKELDELEPYLEVVETKKGKTEWNHMRRMVSTASYSKGVGRGVKFYMKDKKIGKVLGIAELSSDFGNLGARDSFLGWSKYNRFKDKKLKNTAVCSTVVATQPFGYNFLAGKLLCLLLTSDYVRKVWKDKYGDELVGLTTTSLKGHKITPSMYCGMRKYWRSLGHTTGKVLMAPDTMIYNSFRKWLKENFKAEYNLAMSKSGPKQKVLTLLLKKLGLKNKDFMHCFERGVYFSPFYQESKDYLQNNWNGELTNRFDSSESTLVDLWRKKAKKRYLKLVESNKLKYNDLFYSNLIGCTWEQTQTLYLGVEVSIKFVPNTVEVTSSVKDKYMDSYEYVLADDDAIKNTESKLLDKVEFKLENSCLNQSSQMKGVLCNQHQRSFLRTS